MSLKSAQKTDTNLYTLELTCDKERFGAALQKAYEKQKENITVPGFRKGKAPKAFIEKYYGESIFYDDAIDEVFPELYAAAVEEAAIYAVGQPFDFEIKTVSKEGFELSLKVYVKPEVEIGEYKGLTAVKNAVTVEADEVEHRLNHMLEDNARILTVEDRPAQNGDIAVIDFEGFTDGKPFEGGKAEKYDLTLGSGQFIPGFEEQIVGHNAGDAFDVNVKFPEEYAQELAGKDAVFKVVLHEIKVKELPALDDEFAKDVSEFDTLDELKKSIEDEIRAGKEAEAQRNFETQLLDKLADSVNAEIPPVMVEAALDDIINDFSYRMQMQGLDMNTYLQYTGLDMKTMRDGYKDRAERDVKLRLAVEKIAELENIEVTEDDLKAEYDRFAEAYKVDVDTIKKAISEEGLKKDISAKKAMDLVIASAVATEAEEETKEEKPAKPAKKTAKKTTKKAEKAEPKAEDAE